MNLMNETGFAQAHCHSRGIGKEIRKIARKILSGCADRTVSTGIAGEVHAWRASPFLSRPLISFVVDIRHRKWFPGSAGNFDPSK
jgi:hypothetical protein